MTDDRDVRRVAIDGEGDTWHEIEPDCFAYTCPDGTRFPKPLSLTAIAGAYGLRDVRRVVSVLVVTICGSMRFKDLMDRVAEEETAVGRIVLMPHPVVAAAEQDSEVKAILDGLHRAKIDLSARIVVVSDETGYYGESTRGEIEYARERGLSVEFRKVAAQRPVTRRHGLLAVQGRAGCTDVRCTRVEDDNCRGYHCPHCHEPCSSQGHECPKLAV